MTDEERRVLALDIATLVARIEQIDDEHDEHHWLWDRVMTCDVPRLRQHALRLDPELWSRVAPTP